MFLLHNKTLQHIFMFCDKFARIASGCSLFGFSSVLQKPLENTLFAYHNTIMVLRKILFCATVFFMSPVLLFSFGSMEKTKRNSQSQNQVQEIVQETEPVKESDKTGLIGTNEGLFSIDSRGRISAVWQGGTVKKVMFLEDTWILLSDEGVLVSTDLINWETRNEGLPVKTIKVFKDKQKSFLKIVQEIKDLKVNPANINEMAIATKDRVYFSRNQGQSWESLGSPPYRTNGIKSVAVANMPRTGTQSDLTVFLSHSVYGIHYIQPDRPGSKWTELVNGIEKLETTNNPDEVSDIAVRLIPAEDDKAPLTEIYISQTFRRRIYKLDWDRKLFTKIWSDDSPFGTVDSLGFWGNSLGFLYEGTAASLDFSDFTFNERRDILDYIISVSDNFSKQIPAKQILMNSIVINDRQSKNSYSINELWLLDEYETWNVSEKKTPARLIGTRKLPMHAANREGIYLPVNAVRESDRFKTTMDVMEKSGLDMVVIDMKDDFGRLRFTPNNPEITAKGRVVSPIDLDAFIKDMKERGIFTAARIVVFKDPVLAARDNNKYAVWDSRTNRPWVGYEERRRKKSEISDEDRSNSLNSFFDTDDPEYQIVRTHYGENWVDPYSEEVWEYHALIANELYERGFDEIQFDYIRFPTDGVNLGNARYRWRDEGMDMESAILSFLRHIRTNVKAVISIDIYGANGWYRTGARTGQEVELLAHWVDIICPMYYPSHFEQFFLAQDPPELRPWRIYFLGTLRTARVARGQVIVRPWAQAFRLNVSYDRRYYNTDYVRRQVEGTRQAGIGGITYWNQGGRYEDLPPGNR